MSRRRRRNKGPIGAILVALNVAVFGGVAWLLWERARTPVEVTAAPSAQQALAPLPAIDWDARFAADADADPTCAGCNVLMISLDIFRPDHMPCMGYDKPTTPFMCEMAENGVLFENFIVHAYQTPVSQMTLFTGRYASSNGYVSFASLLPDDVAYLPEQMKQAGYETIALGSSFEVMTDMSASESARRRFSKRGLNPGLSFGRGFDRFVFTGNRNLPTDGITWLEGARDKRFFMWMILGTLHWPYGAHGDPDLRDMFDPPQYDGVLAGRRSLNFDVVSRIYQGRIYDKAGGDSQPLTDQDAAFINARYDFGLWTVDQFIGELMAAIPPDVLQNTLILLHGVHGEDLGEHGYFGHYDVYDTEVRSTLIVLNPRHKSRGVRIKEQVEGVDLAPTVLDVLDLPAMPDTDGQSFAAALRDGKGDAANIAYFERIPLWEDIFRHKGGMPEAFVSKVTALLDAEVVGDTGLRTNRWKLLHRTARSIEAQVSWYGWLSGEPVIRSEWQLYDLEADPTEQRDVGPDHPEVLAELQANLLAWEAALPETTREWAPVAP
jgi:arylsulfatase